MTHQEKAEEIINHLLRKEAQEGNSIAIANKGVELITLALDQTAREARKEGDKEGAERVVRAVEEYAGRQRCFPSAHHENCRFCAADTVADGSVEAARQAANQEANKSVTEKE